MPQHSCFYRQKISLPLFGMWGAWGCPLSHRHCLCSNSAARAMTFLIAERLGSGGMHLCLHKVHIVEKILLSQSTFWTSSTMRGFPLHMFKTFVVERENDGAREEGVSSGVAALSRMICYFLFLFYFLLIYPFIITNFSQQKETGLGSGEGRTCMSALGLQRSESTVYININFFLRHEVLTLNCQLVCNTETARRINTQSWNKAWGKN